MKRNPNLRGWDGPVLSDSYDEMLAAWSASPEAQALREAEAVKRAENKRRIAESLAKPWPWLSGPIGSRFD